MSERPLGPLNRPAERALGSTNQPPKRPPNHASEPPRKGGGMSPLVKWVAAIVAGVLGLAFLAGSNSGSGLGPGEPAAAVTTPNVKGSESMQECLDSAGLSSKVDPMEMGAPDYIGVYDSDERMLAIMNRNDTHADATDLANVDNDMERDAAEKAEGDGWDVGTPSVDRGIAVGLYSRGRTAHRKKFALLRSAAAIQLIPLSTKYAFKRPAVELDRHL